MEKTNITELSEFFPATGCSPVSRSKTSQKIKIVPWSEGETYEQAVERFEQKKRRIEDQIAARKATAAVK